MMDKDFQVGQIVTGIYKTGKYVGEILGKHKGRYLIEILAVLKHPIQGDLHHPKQAAVPMFHERRALAYKEKTYIPAVYIKKYEGEVLDYDASLKAVLAEEKKELQKDASDWAKKSLENFLQLEKSYFN